ncbi:MAG TPA: AAA family ATPase [Balneolaceae bacterium]|nr:AAA family ATPase [Balneolaceae bacterium]|tara:strand:+ start:150282 stop:151652 length:1371 start_codon:yes stop_codon:yes gene_type:complete
MDLFQENKSPGFSRSEPGKNEYHQPLATRMRPDSLEEFAGQKHLVGEGKMLRRMIESGVIGSLIFYGPPSSGKTTLAHVISKEIKASFQIINAVLDGIKELRNVVEKAEKLRQLNGRKTILFVDEIHRWNKAQQDALLPHLESGVITLVGATTENPFYSLVNPLLSRCQLFELKPLEVDDVKLMIHRALNDEKEGLGGKKINLSNEALDHLADYAGGDVRNALNALEVAVLSSKPDEDGVIQITLEIAKESIQQRKVRYDRTGDEHYHYASAFIKSMRGSDPDGALYWMNAMLEGGDDPNFIFRRMFILASEDVGLAEPNAITIVNSCHEAFMKCGMPEGMYFLSHAALYLSMCPKSNSAGAIFEVNREIREKGVGAVPPYLKDKTANKMSAQYLNLKNDSEDYKYPHSYPNNWTDQQYLPDVLKKRTFYQSGTEGREGLLKKRMDAIREHQKKSE